MGIKRYMAEEIILKLREAEVEVGRGKAVPELCRPLGITEATYYRWRKEYGGMRVNQAQSAQGHVERSNERVIDRRRDQYPEDPEETQVSFLSLLD